MKIDTLTYQDNAWHTASSHIANPSDAQIVFCFGDREQVEQTSMYEALKSLYPSAQIVGGSSSGNVLGTKISSASAVATALYLEKSSIEVHSIEVAGQELQTLSENLVNRFTPSNLKHLFVISDGLNVNGSQLVQGINNVANQVTVTGGLAGDGANFEKTAVIHNGAGRDNLVVAVGFYGDALTISSGCYGGWSEFGSYRRITKSLNNIVYEIDDEPALALYKRFLGEYAKDLPNSGLRFPLSIKENMEASEVIRTILAVDEATQSITFAGDVPQGYQARLMKPNMEELIQGAGDAAGDILQANQADALGLVVSCVGRKIVLGQLVDDELEEIGTTLGENVQLVGFYSYGEIAPFSKDKLHCELHNQTMTLTAIYES